MLAFAVVAALNDALPKAVLDAPVVFASKAACPTATFSEPVVLA